MIYIGAKNNEVQGKKTSQRHCGVAVISNWKDSPQLLYLSYLPRPTLY